MSEPTRLSEVFNNIPVPLIKANEHLYQFILRNQYCSLFKCIHCGHERCLCDEQNESKKSLCPVAGDIEKDTCIFKL